MEFIVTCGCADTDKFVESAFPLIKPATPLPQIYTPEQALERLGHVGGAYRRLMAMVKTKEKFAFYFNGGECWDLLKGVRIG